MRALFLILSLANLLFFAAQFDSIRSLLPGSGPAAIRSPQVNAERMRIIRDTSSRTATPLPPGG